YCCRCLTFFTGLLCGPKRSTIKMNKIKANLLLLRQRRSLSTSMKSPTSTPVATMRYAERRLLGFSREQMFAVVSGVEHYHRFVPWCTGSQVEDRRQLVDVANFGLPGAAGVSGPGEQFTGRLSIGFPPLLQQSYSSVVTCCRPQLVHSRCTDANLFRLLDTTWRFHPGLSGRPATCILDFGVEFAFQSSLHTSLADLFFDRVVTAMVSAFLHEAGRRYGPESVGPQRPTVLVYKR
ncbi:hypothetical protein BOX15_Mlig000057g2, partial [Macrostomum lignano]